MPTPKSSTHCRSVFNVTLCVCVCFEAFNCGCNFKLYVWCWLLRSSCSCKWNLRMNAIFSLCIFFVCAPNLPLCARWQMAICWWCLKLWMEIKQFHSRRWDDLKDFTWDNFALSSSEIQTFTVHKLCATFSRALSSPGEGKKTWIVLLFALRPRHYTYQPVWSSFCQPPNIAMSCS